MFLAFRAPAILGRLIIFAAYIEKLLVGFAFIAPMPQITVLGFVPRFSFGHQVYSSRKIRIRNDIPTAGRISRKPER